MTTEQILVWVTIGAIGLLAFMVFMYGMARAKYYDECNLNAFLNAKNSNLKTQFDLLNTDRQDVLIIVRNQTAQIARLKQQIAETLLELTAEIEARKETSELLLKAGNELNQLNRQVQKRGKDGRYIKKA